MIRISKSNVFSSLFSLPIVGNINFLLNITLSSHIFNVSNRLEKDMIATITELTRKLDAYLSLSMEEDVYVTRYGTIVAKISNPNKDKIKLVHSLRGSLKTNMSENEIHEERCLQRKK